MFKKITIIVAVLALLLTIFYGITLLKQRNTQSEQAPVTLTISEDGTKLILPNRETDTPLLVPNFLTSNSSIQPVQIIEDTVSGSQTALLKREENYSLYGFSGSDGTSFMVALHGNNLRQARIDGETVLLSLLGITEQQACATNITVIVQSPYDNQVSVTDVRPSFCPGRADLPTAGAGENVDEDAFNRTSPDVSL
jgi:hypothetical protein